MSDVNVDTGVENEAGQTAPEEDEYSLWLKSKGIDPEDTAGVVKTIKKQQDDIENLGEQVNYLNMVAQQASTPREQPSAQQPATKEEAWEQLANQDPYVVMNKIAEKKVNDAVAKSKNEIELNSALKEAQSELEDETPEMQQMIKQTALTMLHTNPNAAKGVTYADKLKNLYRAAKEQNEKVTRQMLISAGIDPSMLSKEKQKPGNMMSNVRSKNRQIPRDSKKVDREAALKSYDSAVEDGNVDKMIELVLQNPFLGEERSMQLD